MASRRRRSGRPRGGQNERSLDTAREIDAAFQAAPGLTPDERRARLEHAAEARED